MDLIPTAVKCQTFISILEEPESSKCSRKQNKIVSKLYRYFVLFLIIYLIVNSIRNILSNQNGNNSQSLFECVAMCSLLGKLFYYFRGISQFNAILSMSRSDICIPKNEIEEKVAEKSKLITSCIQAYAMSLFVLVIFLIIVPCFGSLASRRLPLDAYKVMDLTNIYVYITVYILHSTALFFATSFTAFIDAAAFELLLHNMTQYNLLFYRVHVAVNAFCDSELFKECVQHHIVLRNVIHGIESFFMRIIIIYLGFCYLMLCSLILQLSKENLDIFQMIPMAWLVFALLSLNTIYCRLGCELHDTSEHLRTIIYNSNWTNLNPSLRRRLLLVMTISSQGFTMSFHGIFPLSLETLGGIFKSLYSAYNVLKQM